MAGAKQEIGTNIYQHPPNPYLVLRNLQICINECCEPCQLIGTEAAGWGITQFYCYNQQIKELY